MKTDAGFTDVITRIKSRIAALQSALIGLQEQLKKEQNNFDGILNNSAVKIIDILDLIDTVTANVSLNKEADLELLVKKIKSNLGALLQEWQVEEITGKEQQIACGKIRVLSTIPAAELQAGTIIEVCRKGYQRCNKVIRPVDVITTK